MTLVLRWRMLDPPLMLRWRGPDGTVEPLVSGGALASLAAIVGPPGADGASVPPLSLLSDITAPVGTPLAVSRATGHLIAANAATKAGAFVIGLAAAALSTGFIGECERASLTLADWTAIAGTASLSAGQNYFLGVGGGLVIAPPGSPNCLTLVGIAASANTLLIDAQSPIQL